MEWDENIEMFLRIAYQHEVRMIMVGDAAANHYGFTIPLTHLDFWIEATSTNLNKIRKALREIGSRSVDFYIPAIDRKRNVSIEFPPSTVSVLLLTQYVIAKSFTWAYDDSLESASLTHPGTKWRVLALEDLIDAKSKSLDPREVENIRKLRKINKLQI